MPYQSFAYWYDVFNQAADYDCLTKQLLSILQKHGVKPQHLVADLGCGTGEVTLRLSAAGYDMLAVDASGDMLCVLQDKMMQQGRDGILLLEQDLVKLDLYGTVMAAVSTFDTLNHLTTKQLQQAIARLSLFIEPCGMFLFDANTPYKHQHVLADNQFTIETEDAVCVWKNTYDAENAVTDITVTAEKDGQPLWTERFREYVYSLAFWKDLLTEGGFEVLQVLDGEAFAPLCEESQRYLIVAQKRRSPEACP